jgi:predicted DNA-binding transcriptional regulator YafY
MPQHAKGDVILRQWEMLRLVPSHDHPGRTAPELAGALESRGYRVTRRTIERDLEGLQQCLPLEVDTRSRPQRWRWRKSRGLDIPGMEAAEAMALFMMRDAMAAHLPSCFLEALHSRFAQADKTLAVLARSGANVRWADRVRVVPAHVVLKPPRIAPRIVQTLQHALLNDIPVEADYQSLQETAPRRRLLYPRALIPRGSSLYLIAHQKDGGAAPHHYAVQRFSAVRLRELEPWPKMSFSLDGFLDDGTDQFGDGHEIRLKARVSPELNRILRDSPLSADMRIDGDKDGALLMTATVRDTWALHSWALGHSEHLCILQPASLRTRIAGRLRAAAMRYA